MEPKIRLKRLLNFLQREKILQLLLVVMIIVLVSGFVISLLEDITFPNAIWWSIVTLTTVGYGDISPATTGGRIIAVLIMFFGIGLLGMLSAGLAAIIISHRMKEDKGMCASNFENHIILCEWNHRAKAILKELRADTENADTPIVLIAGLEEKPVDDPNLFFIKGTVSEETLERANLTRAKTVVVLGDDNIEPTSRDAKVVLTTLTIESLSNNVYTVVELVDEKNVRHCKRAHADEIIVGSELSSNLIASAATDHGISRIVSELLSTQYGNNLSAIPASSDMVDKSFLDVFVAMKKDKNSTVLGIQKGRGGELITNPPTDYKLSANDYLVIIS